MAGHGGPVRDHAQAPHLRADRRPGRRGHRGSPEQVGGERNWDYRYTWLRDASFSVQALDRLGFTEDAMGFALWLRNTLEQTAAADGFPLQLMYRVDGSADLEEYTLDNFEGYEGSAPVRIGNGASDQLQLDIYGEAWTRSSSRRARRAGHRRARLERLAGSSTGSCDNWDQPEEGIWETRGGRQSFVYGRVMCWVALDRAIRMAHRPGPGPAAARAVDEGARRRSTSRS